MPGLATRLVRSRRLSGQQWDQAVAASGQDQDVGAALVGLGLIARNDLKAVLLSVTVDTLILLAAPALLPVPPAAGATAGDIRFLPRQRHWSRSFLRVSVDSAWQEAGRSAARLARRGVHAAAQPRPRGQDHRAATGPWQSAIARQIDGRATIGDLAWRNGIALHEAMQCVDDLARSGLCAVDRAGAPAALPRRCPQPPRPAGGGSWAPVDPAVLRRVLRGLKRLGLSAAGPFRR